MKSPEKYMKKNAEKMDTVQRSVNIKVEHQEFIEAKNFNLSEMVRDLIDDIMSKMKKDKSA